MSRNHKIIPAIKTINSIPRINLLGLALYWNFSYEKWLYYKLKPLYPELEELGSLFFSGLVPKKKIEVLWLSQEQILYFLGEQQCSSLIIGYKNDVIELFEEYLSSKKVPVIQSAIYVPRRGKGKAKASK